MTATLELTPSIGGFGPEDWSIYVAGICYGYLYRCKQTPEAPYAYSVGIGQPGQDITFHSIKSTKQDALTYAEQHIAQLQTNSKEA